LIDIFGSASNNSAGAARGADGDGEHWVHGAIVTDAH
jgi:hypothetical protein